MEILSNWWFWIIIATIVFVLALIGYLTESMKKGKNEENDTVSNDDVKNEPVATTTEEPKKEPVADDWMNMPEVSKPLEEVKVDTINETPSVEANDVFTSPMSAESVSTTEEVKPVESETLNVASEASTEVPNMQAEPTVEPVQTSEPVQNTPVEPEKKEETNTDIWGM